MAELEDFAILADVGPDTTSYQGRTIDGCAIVKTQDGRILLQRRTLDAPTIPGWLALFGGGQEDNESASEILCRELAEELGAVVDLDNAVCLGATRCRYGERHKVSVVFFWHDKAGTITGCYEGAPEYYASVVEALKADKLHPQVEWGLKECLRHGLIAA